MVLFDSSSLPMRTTSLFLSLVAVCSFAIAGPAAAQFADRTHPCGLYWCQPTWSAAFVDMELDGDLDLYVGHHYEPPLLYWNDGQGIFDRCLHEQPWSGPVDRHGVLALSFDTDEDPDVFIAHGSASGFNPEPNELYRNDGGGTFAELLDAGDLGDQYGRSRAASAADFDGDFVVDLWVGKAPNEVSLNSLYKNHGGFYFTDVAPEVCLAESCGTVGGLWGDVDDDGDPDLLVGGEEFQRPTCLYRNDGGAFANASASFTPALPTVSGADFGDFDNDDDLDLAACDGYIGVFDGWEEGDTLSYFFNSRFADTGLDGLSIPSNGGAAHARLALDGYYVLGSIFLGPQGVHPAEITFELTDAYVGAPSFNPGVDKGTWLWRESPGGTWELRCSTPDIGTTNFSGILFEDAVIYGCIPIELEDPGFVPGGPRVWRNDGGAFVEITAALGLPTMLNPRDISWVDYDNDGDLDLHVVDMGTSAWPNAPDRLLRNDGAAFTDVTAAEGVAGGSEGLADGAVWGDIDSDGDLDLYLQEGAGPRALFSGVAPQKLYRNEGNRGHSIQLTLVGGASGIPAIGTRVAAHIGGKTIHRRVQANSWRGFQDPLRVHLGLGAATTADSVVIEWPSGNVDVHLGVPAGIWRLVEGTSCVTGGPLPRPASTGAPGWHLDAVAPQPSSGLQWIRLRSDESTSLRVSIYDIAGRCVRELHDGPLTAGTTRLTWNGLDARGRAVAAGMYYVRATDGRTVLTARVVRLR
jgi:hypothetical protein